MLTHKEQYSGEEMRLGRENELIVKQFLASQGWTNIEDLTCDQKFWRPDVDFKATDPNGEEFKLETKVDRRIGETKNLFFEESRIYNQTEFYIGWAYRSQADLLLVRDSINNVLYEFNFKRLRNKVDSLKRGGFIFQHRDVLMPGHPKVTTGRLVPLSQLVLLGYSEEFQIFKKHKL